MKNKCLKNIMKTIKKLTCILLLLNMSACVMKYPVTLYDKDLTDDERIGIQERIDEKENEKYNKDESPLKNKVVFQDSVIDNDYIAYEDSEFALSNSESFATTQSNFPVVVLFKNQPDFDLKQYKAEVFEKYSDLDSLGRVGKAEAMIGKESMPTTARESIGMIKPSGWHTVKYDN